MRVLLISTYELGRQPFGLASPAAWLRAEGHEVTVVDLACNPLPRPAVEQAEAIAFYLPMHTATRLFLRVLDRVKSFNPEARLCAYGLYAPLNAALLRRNGVGTVVGGEFEQGLVDWARGDGPDRASVSLARQRFLVPDRAGMPPLAAYAQLVTNGATQRVGYTEASRGCKHLCRHCPVVPVYRGQFRIVQPEVVLADIRQQVAAGAGHITFGDPDFLNGPRHAVQIVEALHAEWPELTYDATIKIEHLLKHQDLLRVLKQTGCVLVISAVESLDDSVLRKLEKGHTRADFEKALSLMRDAGLEMSPTFIPFTPWTTREGYREFLQALMQLDLAGDVAPIQLAIRLLIPEGSLMLEMAEVRAMIEPYDHRALCYPWHNRDRSMDQLCIAIQETIKREERKRSSRLEIFRAIGELAQAGSFPDVPMAARATIPYLTEPWYC
ncbi:MAG TPA: CUAEP/CCAEP-tail radical SAM protein [Bryobacteraceae bacterium]|nr:CUAEP/CCAEP-tail radical SAM protein [Bryobacteraceae bacterium]